MTMSHSLRTFITLSCLFKPYTILIVISAVIKLIESIGSYFEKKRKEKPAILLIYKIQPKYFYMLKIMYNNFVSVHVINLAQA